MFWLFIISGGLLAALFAFKAFESTRDRPAVFAALRGRADRVVGGWFRRLRNVGREVSRKFSVRSSEASAPRTFLAKSLRRLADKFE